jgi:hypothetical protein
MDSKGFPSIQREYESYDDQDNNDIFQNTSVDPGSYDNNKKLKKSKGVNGLNMQNLTKKSQPSIPLSNGQRNNNFFRSTNNIDKQETYYDDMNENKLVPTGYFERSPNSMGPVSDLNSTSRYTENRIVSHTEFPKLNKTIRTETLYSIKSQLNSSPHSRILQSLEKRKKKPKMSIPDTNDNLKEGQGQNRALANNIPKYKPKNATRNKHNNSKQFYEITTIEEGEETSTQDFNKSQRVSGAMANSKSVQKHNYRYNSMDEEGGRHENRHDIPHASMTDPEHNRSINQKNKNFDQNYMNKAKGGYAKASSNNTVDLRNQQAESERLKNLKPVLPKIRAKIPGITTQNGSFKPYTYTVRVLIKLYRISKDVLKEIMYKWVALVRTKTLSGQMLKINLRK